MFECCFIVNLKQTNLSINNILLQIEKQRDGVNVLHLLDVDHNLSGEVKCSVFSRENPKIFNVYHTSLTVIPIPISDKYESIENLVENNNSNSNSIHDLTAYIIKGPDDCTVLIGDSIKLEVTFIGYPVPKVKWLRAVSCKQFKYFVLCCFTLKCKRVKLHII